MSLAILPVSQLFGRYEQQARMAELNRKSPVKTIQSQVDWVTISPKALKKRAIDGALAAIPTSKQISTETKPASGDDVKSTSYADRIVQDALDKSREPKKKEEDGPADQSGGVYENVVKEILEEKEKAVAEEAAKKKEQYEREATPF